MHDKNTLTYNANTHAYAQEEKYILYYLISFRRFIIRLPLVYHYLAGALIFSI